MYCDILFEMQSFISEVKRLSKEAVPKKHLAAQLRLIDCTSPQGQAYSAVINTKFPFISTFSLNG